MKVQDSGDDYSLPNWHVIARPYKWDRPMNAIISGHDFMQLHFARGGYLLLVTRRV
jgi:hypothetical protein